MRDYSNKISLAKNARGVYSLDVSLGCKSGTQQDKRGCYGDCYAAKSAKLYGYDFNKTVFRYFESEVHKKRIINQIKRIPLGFVRIGTSGDPSENWAHTLDVCNVIAKANKDIVIITKHWTTLTDAQLDNIQTLDLLGFAINTSVSALDTFEVLQRGLTQYERLKPFCKSLLRVVSCDFNTDNATGKQLAEIQKKLFDNEGVIDTVLRVNKNNPLVREGVLRVKESKFLGKKALISKYNPKTYFGKCSTCLEMCGVNM